jgi:uncharacterized SAM-binding protein YcdF (DUF218 family)
VRADLAGRRSGLVDDAAGVSVTAWLIPGPVHAVAALAVLTIAAFRSGRRSRLRRWRWPCALLLALAWIGATPGFAELGLRALEGAPPADHRAATTPPAARDGGALIMVLASGEMHAPTGEAEVRLDIHGVERVRAAVALWRQTGGRLLMTGGPGLGPDDSLAGGMARLAIDLGVPAEAVDRSPGSLTTQQDIACEHELIAAHRGPRWLVTSASHMPRALATARRAGLDLEPWPTDYRQIRRMTWRSWWPDPQAHERAVPVLHEWIGWAVYRLRGWA